MKKYLIPSILVLFCIITASRPVDNQSFTLSTEKKYAPKEAVMSVLALYGNYVFEREKCGNCHSGMSYSFISLDGLGGKYSDAWHYNHLLSPQSVSYGSNMPEYPHLFKQEINKNKVSELIEKAQKQGLTYPKGFEKMAYEKLKEEANEQTKGLKAQGVETKSLENKEILALIAFLQQMPISPKKRRNDSIQAAEEAKRQAILFKSDEKNLQLFAMSTHKDTIEMGKAIYERVCTPCHGQKGEGAVGPNLTDKYWLHGSSPEKIANIIQNGAPQKGMIGWKNQLMPSDIGKLVCYIRALQGSNPPNAKEAQGTKE